ncbi:DgyrCDS1502 [Dimorphilus gyrociliatus]|uniref:DgyrCDS1502 n=1 Tax=Dimorphilus gyrociliatus TaxID=2664684 RepID=A0A7I8V9M5_9ANNE|nr:DgyrCDS1502 [Dimorphilus gyrociliatus]
MTNTGKVKFGWKRKLGDTVVHSIKEQFENDSANETTIQDLEDTGIDWLTLRPKKPALQLEDALAKCQRLKGEGCTLADNERYWEAIDKWNQALQLVSAVAEIHEMKAQAYMALGEVMPAIQSAEEAAKYKPNWYLAWQTLGRCQLNLGEVSMAIRSFSKALHLQPTSLELREEDIKPTLELLKKFKKRELQKKIEERALKDEQEKFTSVDINSEEVRQVLKECEEYFESNASLDEEETSEQVREVVKFRQ